MSRDLVALGIAAQNMTPNSPSLDARPLFQAALDHVRNNSIANVTVDPGAYYFLTSQYPNDYLVIAMLSNVTIDLAGSTIYLKDPWPAGIMLWLCQHVTFTNFKIDYINPPYTHVTLTSVDAANRVLRYASMNGWPQDPSIFNAYASASEISSVVAVAFRNGRIVPGTSRMPLQAGIGGGALPLFQNVAPWTQAATLSTLQPGDTIVETFRGGAAGPLKCWYAESVTLSHFTIHGANNWAVEVTHASNTIVDHARIEPRPGALIGSSADGIHFHNSRRNNHIRNSYVTATVDDALIMQSLAVATVTAQNGSQLVVTRTGYDRFPNGTAVNFVDTTTGVEIAGATIVAQNPGDSLGPGFGETVTLTLSQALPNITPGMRMVFADATMRGSGSTVEDNIVENILMGRGVWIGGSRGLTIQRNVIRTTSSAAISLFEDTINFVGPPAHDVVIQGNRLESNLGPMASGSLDPVRTGSRRDQHRRDGLVSVRVGSCQLEHLGDQQHHPGFRTRWHLDGRDEWRHDCEQSHRELAAASGASDLCGTRRPAAAGPRGHHATNRCAL